MLITVFTIFFSLVNKGRVNRRLREGLTAALLVRWRWGTDTDLCSLVASEWHLREWPEVVLEEA